MIKLSHVKQIKSTLLGLVFIAVAILAIFKIETLDTWIFISLLVAGILLIFSPNNFIKALSNLVLKNSDINLKDNSNDS